MNIWWWEFLCPGYCVVNEAVRALLRAFQDCLENQVPSPSCSIFHSLPLLSLSTRVGNALSALWLLHAPRAPGIPAPPRAAHEAACTAGAWPQVACVQY